MEHVHALEPAIMLLLVGILAIVLMRPLGMSPIVGYLVAGVAIGPQGLSLISSSETTRLLAELGVVFLLFDIGLHFSLRHIWDARRDILGLGPLQMALCAAGLGAVGLLAGRDVHVSLIVGATLALSSTAVVVQTLAERGQQSCPLGRTAVGVLIFQDICAIFLLILAGSMGASAESLALTVGAAAVKAAAAFAAAMIVGRFLVRPLFRLLSQTRHEDIFTTAALLIVLVTAAATGTVGLSLTLGAFLGGMVLSETPYRHVIQAEVKPFRGLLLGFFFITVGMSLDVAAVMESWLLVLLLVVFLVSAKVVLIWLAALAVGMSATSAARLGFLLFQGSEFAFVVLAMPGVRDALAPGSATVIITGVAVSMALTPTLSGLGEHVARVFAARSYDAQSGEGTAPAPPSAPLLLFGMGEIGRRVADGLAAHGIEYTAVEMDHDRFIAASADGYAVSFGDAGDPRMMQVIDVAQRPMVVVTITRYEVSRSLTPIMRERYPNLARFVTVSSEDDQRRFEALGMRAVVDRSFPAGLDLAVEVLRANGVDEERVREWVRGQQELALAGTGDEPQAA